MFDKLPPDIIYSIIINFTNIHDIINLSIVNKDTYTIFDDYIYMYWGRYIYTNEFWEKAQQRSPKVSRPLLNMKQELLRINKFTNHLIKHGMEIWTKKDYYIYWISMEDALRKPIKQTKRNKLQINSSPIIP
jgi:hypothetical protein